MENGNKPAYPDPMIGADQSYHNQAPHEEAQGFTKREAIAMAAMQGMLSASNVADLKYIASASVKAADALLKALEEPQK